MFRNAHNKIEYDIRNITYTLRTPSMVDKYSKYIINVIGLTKFHFQRVSTCVTRFGFKLHFAFECNKTGVYFLI